jgi:hypothetical protein
MAISKGFQDAFCHNSVINKVEHNRSTLRELCAKLLHIINPSIRTPFVHLSVHLSIIHPSIHQSINQSINQSIHQSIPPSIHLSIHSYIHPYTRRSIHPNPSVYLDSFPLSHPIKMCYSILPFHRSQSTNSPARPKETKYFGVQYGLLVLTTRPSVHRGRLQGGKGY